MTDDHQIETVDPEEIAGRIAQSKFTQATKFVPLSDGNVAYFQGEMFRRGYVLSPGQAQELFTNAVKKGFGSTEALIFVGIILVTIRVAISLLPDAFELAILLVAGITFFLGIFVSDRIANRKFRSKYPDRPACRFGHRNDYTRMRHMLTTMGSERGVLVFTLVCGLFALSLLSVGVVMLGGVLAVLAPLPIIGGCLFIWLSYFAFSRYRLHRRFRRLHGRKLSRDDLRPVDPETGKMVPDPFTTQMQVGRG